MRGQAAAPHILRHLDSSGFLALSNELLKSNSYFIKMVSHHMLLRNREEMKTCESAVLLQVTPSFSDLGVGVEGWCLMD